MFCYMQAPTIFFMNFSKCSIRCYPLAGPATVLEANSYKLTAQLRNACTSIPTIVPVLQQCDSERFQWHKQFAINNMSFITGGYATIYFILGLCFLITILGTYCIPVHTFSILV